MFCLDIESCGLESTTIILSVGIVYYDDTKPLTYQGLLDDSIFVKFDAIDQRTNYGRTVTPSTLDWWRKQSTLAQDTNLKPSPKDLSAKEGIAILRKWFTGHKDYKSSMIWVRGTLDQPAVESLIRALDEAPFAPYNNYRDIRTALDCFYPETKNGYIDVDTEKCPDFNFSKVLKHHPVHDAAYDLCMLLAGKSE